MPVWEEMLDVTCYVHRSSQMPSWPVGMPQGREEPSQSKHAYALSAIEKAAEGEENLMPHFIEAAKAKATLGEMCDVLRGVFGEYREGSDF